MNQAMNAYSSDLRIIKRSEGNYSEGDVWIILSQALKKCPRKKCNKREMCESIEGFPNCRCAYPSESCENVNYTRMESDWLRTDL